MPGITVSLGAYEPPKRENRLEQLTDVRNYVRREMGLHEEATGAELEVTWFNGTVETVRFDEYVGYPIGTTGKEWLDEWKENTIR